MSADGPVWTRPPSGLPHRSIDGHKGSFGRLLIVGGSATMIGAPMFAALAALRIGVGLVQVAMPGGVLAAALTIVPEAIGLALEGDESLPSLRAAAEHADAVVVGPGMGDSPEAWRRWMTMLETDKPGVLDADALNLLAREEHWPTHARLRAVLTPHPGEMRRLGRLFDHEECPEDHAGRLRTAHLAAGALRQVVLLKGHRTIVTDARQTYVNATGNDALAKAGSGDVLSGVIGALLAQGMSPFDAACLGAHLHGRAGELAAARLGRRGVLARDLANTLPRAIAAIK